MAVCNEQLRTCVFDIDVALGIGVSVCDILDVSVGVSV
jgi:hypothetical protein